MVSLSEFPHARLYPCSLLLVLLVFLFFCAQEFPVNSVQLVLDELFLGGCFLLMDATLAEDCLRFHLSLLFHVLQLVEQLCLEIACLRLLLLLPERPRLLLLQVHDDTHAFIRHVFELLEAQAFAVFIYVFFKVLIFQGHL